MGLRIIGAANSVEVATVKVTASGNVTAPSWAKYADLFGCGGGAGGGGGGQGGSSTTSGAGAAVHHVESA